MGSQTKPYRGEREGRHYHCKVTMHSASHTDRSPTMESYKEIQVQPRTTKLGIPCRIQIAGSWSNWEPQPCKLTDEGLWEIELDLVPGIYEYKYLFNNVWVLDTSKPFAKNLFGTENNVLIVEREGEPKKSSLKEANKRGFEERVDAFESAEMGGKKKKCVSFGTEDDINEIEEIEEIETAESSSPKPHPFMPATSFTSILKQVGRSPTKKIERRNHENIFKSKSENAIKNIVEEEYQSQLLPCDPASTDREEIPIEYVTKVAQTDEVSSTDISVSDSETNSSDLIDENDFINNVELEF